MVDLCIYPVNNIDGFTAAWAVKKRHPEAELHPTEFKDAAPYCEGRDVAIVGFAYPYEIIADMSKVADNIAIIDHHQNHYYDIDKLNHEFDNVTAEFNAERSSASMAWEYFHGKESTPMFVECVEDQELGKWEVAGSKQLHAYLTSWPYELKIWDDTHRELQTNGALSNVFLIGGGIMRAKTKSYC